MGWLLNPRIANGLGALACAGLMGFALFAQYGLQLDPCPLCILQRIAVTGLGIVFFVASLHGPGWVGRAIYGLLAVAAAGAGAGVAGRQVWLQGLPPDKVPAVSPAALQANSEPTGRGEEPRVATMVHNQAVSPRPSHCVRCSRTSWSRLCMPAFVCYP